MIELIFAVALVAGLGALFGGLKGARIAVALVIALVVLAVAGVFGYAEYNDYQRTERQKAEVQRQAEQEKAEAQQQAAACSEWEAKHPLGSPLVFVHLKGIGEAVEGPPLSCVGIVEDDYNSRINEWREQSKAKAEADAAKAEADTAKAKRRYVYATSDLDVTSEWCDKGINEGVLTKGERVEVLDTNLCGVKVRTAKGIVGWVYGNQVLTAVAPKTETREPTDASLDTYCTGHPNGHWHGDWPNEDVDCSIYLQGKRRH